MKSTAKKHIGGLIKQHRIKNKLTLHDLAIMLDTDRQYVWNIENGRINISLDYLDDIITKLKCTHTDFFKTLKE